MSGAYLLEVACGLDPTLVSNLQKEEMHELLCHGLSIGMKDKFKVPALVSLTRLQVSPARKGRGVTHLASSARTPTRKSECQTMRPKRLRAPNLY